MLKHFYKIIVIILINITPILPQAFGFGCFGFVGGFAGYTYQEYKPGYFDDQIKAFNSATANSTLQIIPQFGKAQGYRVGINFFRANFSKVFISLKGYYEMLSEKHNFTYQSSNEAINSELELDLKSWNVGLDFGIPISEMLSWKIVEGNIHFNSAKLNYKPNLANNTLDVKFNNDSPEIGYSIATGFVVSLIKNFASIEGTAGYRFFKIKQMTGDNGQMFSLVQDSNQIAESDFIKAGGFNASIQLNVGFPL